MPTPKSVYVKKTKKLKVLVIDRAKWGMGALSRTASIAGPGGEKGQQCCLGFAARACGVPVKAIIGGGYILSERDPAELVPTWLRGDAGDAGKLATINDDFFGTIRAEEEIECIFAEHGTTVKFVGWFPPGLVPKGRKRGDRAVKKAVR